MKKYICSALLLLSATTLSVRAQNPLPGQAQKAPIALVGGDIYVGNGKTISKGILVFDKGKITAIGTDKTIIPAKAEVIEITGKHVYPGIISPYAQAGLNEIGAVRTTQDFSEVGDYNPNVRALIAYNTDSEVIPTIRGNGILIGQVTPSGGIIPGTSSIVHYDGWNWEDAALKVDDGIWMSWPARISRNFDFATMNFTTGKNPKYEQNIQELRQLFTEAKKYAEISNPSNTNLKLASMKGLFTGSQQLFLEVNEGKEIIEAIQFAEQQGVKRLVLVGVENPDLAIPLIKEKNIPVLLSGTHRLPNKTDDDVWNPYKLPSDLMNQGILVGMFYNASYWRTRNLPFVAGTAAAHGLTPVQALQMITENNAKILGIADRVGTLEVGKDATIVISAGDILDMRTNKVSHAFIQGKKVDLDDKQKRLYHKFSEKLEIDHP
mgnify:CR=1 FL=1